VVLLLRNSPSLFLAFLKSLWTNHPNNLRNHLQRSGLKGRKSQPKSSGKMIASSFSCFPTFFCLAGELSPKEPFLLIWSFSFFTKGQMPSQQNLDFCSLPSTKGRGTPRHRLCPPMPSSFKNLTELTEKEDFRRNLEEALKNPEKHSN